MTMHMAFRSKTEAVGHEPEGCSSALATERLKEIKPGLLKSSVIENLRRQVSLWLSVAADYDPWPIFDAF
jgi:hypothetical protein